MKVLSRTLLLFLGISLLLISCSQDGPSWSTVQTTDDRLHAIEGFNQPEAVRFDPAQDLWFVSNLNGSGSAQDSNGYISAVRPNGEIQNTFFISGSEDVPLHAPRGMYITGDTLWVADVLGVHAFHRVTGAPLAFVDFSRYGPGFLNDVTEGSDGAIYVTDTGNATVYRIDALQLTGAVDNLETPPNGITRNPANGELVLAPYDGSRTFYALADQPQPVVFAEAQSGGNFDGIEFVGNRLIAASQADSSLHMLRGDTDRVFVSLPGRPADIGVDPGRHQVAVPYIALNRVDIWQLPR